MLDYRFKVHFSRMEKVISPVFVQIGDLWQHCSVTFLPLLECNCSCFHHFIFYNIKWCPILLHHVDSLWLCINIIHAEWYWITLKVINKVINDQFVSCIVYLFGLIYQKWYMMWPMFAMAHVCQFLYDISDYFMTINLGWHLRGHTNGT